MLGQADIDAFSDWDAPAADSMLCVRGLSVRFRTADGVLEAVRGVGFDLKRGETLAIVGESGSGKSQAVMAALGLLAPNGEASGSVVFRGGEILNAAASTLDKIRGRKITMIFQEPMTSLDPLFTIAQSLTGPLRHHGGLSREMARARALELLTLVRIPDAERRLDAYPHELSGGQRQRVMIAMAIANNPDVLIADEPTTALDVTIAAEILELLRDLQGRLGMAIIFISHDLTIVRRFATRVLVMSQGEVVEEGVPEALFAAPKHAITKALVDAEPRGRKQPPDADAPVLLKAEHITVRFPIRAPWPKPRTELVAVDDVSLTLRRGATLGVVGESGSGKSTLGRALLRLTPAGGQVSFEDRALAPLSKNDLRPLRRSMQLVFQDPFGSLSPRMTIGEIVTEGLLVHERSLNRAARDARAAEALAEVKLDPATRHRFPHEFSGGQRQRIAIARALILKPHLIVLDEPTSALDRTVQSAIVDLLRDIQARYNLTYVFISHDLAVVRALADQVIVMKEGRVVEDGPTDQVMSAPREEYTRSLMQAAFGGMP